MSVGYYFRGKDQLYRKQAQMSRSPGALGEIVDSGKEVFLLEKLHGKVVWKRFNKKVE